MRVAKAPQPEAFLGPNGFIGDRHEAEFRRKRDGTVIANRRKWSAVSTEEVEALCADLGVEPFAIGALGENLRLAGAMLADIPDGTVLEFPSGARLIVSEQNVPCVFAARELAQAYGANVEADFVRKSLGRRGLVGGVLEPGVIRAGDVARVVLPATQPPLPQTN